jgi:hypothetical protein
MSLLIKGKIAQRKKQIRLSENDLILHVLNAVVELGGPFVMCIINETSHVVAGLEGVQVDSKPLLQLEETLLLKAGEATIEHESN